MNKKRAGSRNPRRVANATIARRSGVVRTGRWKPSQHGLRLAVDRDTEWRIKAESELSWQRFWKNSRV